MNAASLLALGFLLGMRHALDPDHVVAVTTIVARHPSPRRAAWIGVLWGLGHSATVLLLGGVIVWFKLAISNSVAVGLELGVAAMLILLGFANLRQGTARDHTHASAARPVLVGMMHGLAGSAAVALLVLATVSDPHWALGYLALFGVGTIAGMSIVTSAIAMPMAAATNRMERLRPRLVLASGVASIAFGVWFAVQLVQESGVLASGAAH
jgi:high-affinity nickel permease